MDRRSCSKSISTRPIVFSLVIALVTVCTTSRNSLSKDGCAYPNIFAPTLAPPVNQAGEFFIELHPPDYQTVTAVQNHLVFSTIWAKSLSPKLQTHTHGRCRVVMSVDFPDLRALLIDSRPENAGPGPSICANALRDVMLSSQPDSGEIMRISSLEARRKLSELEDIDHQNPYILNLLRNAVSQIYSVGSVMHSVTSIKPVAFQSLDIDTFLAWLRHQQLSGNITLDPLLFCKQNNNEDALADKPVEKFPPSMTKAAGPLNLPRKDSQHALIPSLRYIVIVGEGPVTIFSRSTPVGMSKYCDQEHEFSSDHGTQVARIRCFRSVFYGESWTVFYCDPATCASPRMAETVATAIAMDADIRLFAGKKTKGPYLVRFESETK